MRNLIGVEHLRKAFSNARRAHIARWVVAHLAPECSSNMAAYSSGMPATASWGITIW